MKCFSHNKTKRFGAGLFLLSMVLFAGCRKEEITVYRVPKEKEPEMVVPPGNQAAATQPQIQWKTPVGWEEQAPGGMSIASFLIPGDAGAKAQLSVMTFPGEGAGELSLINIVRENAGLPPLNEIDLSKLVESVDVGKVKGKLIDLTAGVSTATNASPNRILIAVTPHEGITWFFKLAGDATVVAAQKSALLAFLKSVSFVEGGEASVRGAHFASTNVKRVPGEPNAPAQNDDAESPNKPLWEIPANWREAVPSQMLLSKFIAGGNDGEAEISVSAFPGDVGGLLANVNRWRGQVGLAPVAEGELDKQVSSLDVIGGKAMLVDMNGQNSKTGKPTRLIGVIWPRGGQTWFYKLMGDSAVAEREKAAFVKFVQSVRYQNA